MASGYMYNAYTCRNVVFQYCHKYYQTRVSLSQHIKSHTCIFHCEICSRDFGSYSGFMSVYTAAWQLFTTSALR